MMLNRFVVWMITKWCIPGIASCNERGVVVVNERGLLYYYKLLYSLHRSWLGWSNPRRRPIDRLAIDN